MEKQLSEAIEMDMSLQELCQNSIDLIEYARGITGKQINIIQLMTLEFPKQCLAFLRKKRHSHFRGLIIFN